MRNLLASNVKLASKFDKCKIWNKSLPLHRMNWIWLSISFKKWTKISLSWNWRLMCTSRKSLGSETRNSILHPNLLRQRTYRRCTKRNAVLSLQRSTSLTSSSKKANVKLLDLVKFKRRGKRGLKSWSLSLGNSKSISRSWTLSMVHWLSSMKRWESSMIHANMTLMMQLRNCIWLIKSAMKQNCVLLKRVKDADLSKM
jgi:hypothetical protein